MAIRRAYADVNERQLHYRYCGDPQHPVLLLLHQTPSNSAMYCELMGRLEGQFFVLAPDTPGFGNSDALPVAITMETLAETMFCFLQSLDLRVCGVFGHHTGAAIAVQLAHDYPAMVSALALSGPPLLNEQQRRALPDAATPFPLHEDGSHLLAMWQRLRGKDGAAELGLTQRELLSAFSCGDAYQDSYKAVCEQDFTGQLNIIQCPALVFAGDADPLHDAVAPTLERLQYGQSLQLPPAAGTYCCEQQAELLADNLASFFAASV